MPRRSDVPCQAGDARTIVRFAARAACGFRDGIVQGRGRDLKTTVIKL
jgi:hypothetical protein